MLSMEETIYLILSLASKHGLSIQGLILQPSDWKKLKSEYGERAQIDSLGTIKFMGPIHQVDVIKV